MSIIEFEEIYKKYEREIYAYIYSIARQDKYAAEEILQCTMINVYKYIHTLNDEKKLKPWIFAIAKNEASRYFFEKDKIKEISLNGDYTEMHENGFLEPDFSFELISDKVFLIIISELDVDEQTILILRYKFGMRLSEMSKMWNVNNNTIKTIHFRAIKKLKELYDSKR